MTTSATLRHRPDTPAWTHGPPAISVREVPGFGRFSTVRRADGSTFTVSVPAAAMEDVGAEPGTWTRGWISDEPGGRPSDPGVARLALVATAPLERVVRPR